MIARHSSAALQTSAGLALSPNASVEVRLDGPGGGSLAALFSDTDGLVPLANPFLADADGHFSFCAAGRIGGYQVTVTKSGGGESRVLSNVAVGTAAQRDATEYAGDKLLSAETAAAAVNSLGLKVHLERAQRRARHFAAQNYV